MVGVAPRAQNVFGRGFGACENHLVGHRTPHPFFSNFLPLCLPVWRQIIQLPERRVLIEHVTNSNNLVCGGVLWVIFST